jgi:AMMECR1 domain-containing protein
MQNIVREIIETYLSTHTVPKIENIASFQAHKSFPSEASMVFITLYRGGEIIASAGRMQPLHTNVQEELLDATLSALRDDRLTSSLTHIDDLKTTQIRLDIVPLSKRQVIANVQEIDVQKHGSILLSQNHMKSALLLPNITNIATTSEEIFYLLTKKAGLDPVLLTTADYTLYRFESDKYSDF